MPIASAMALDQLLRFVATHEAVFGRTYDSFRHVTGTSTTGPSRPGARRRSGSRPPRPCFCPGGSWRPWARARMATSCRDGGSHAAFAGRGARRVGTRELDVVIATRAAEGGVAHLHDLPVVRDAPDLLARAATSTSCSTWRSRSPRTQGGRCSGMAERFARRRPRRRGAELGAAIRRSPRPPRPRPARGPGA